MLMLLRGVQRLSSVMVKALLLLAISIYFFGAEQRWEQVENTLYYAIQNFSQAWSVATKTTGVVPEQAIHDPLPADFLAELEREVLANGGKDHLGCWQRIQNSSDDLVRRDRVILLAYQLPRVWWTVNDELIHQRNLLLVFVKRGPTTLTRVNAERVATLR